MKAMLYADWMNLRRSMKAMVIATVVIALASIVSGNGLAFVPAMLCMLSLMVPATLMSSDYAYGWDKLSLSLPVSRRDVVSSKFAISLLVNLTVVALGMICIAGMNAFGGDAMAEDMMGMLACEAVGLTLMGIEIVLVLRFGPERGRYFLIGVVWVPILLLTVVKKASGVRQARTGGRRHGQLAGRTACGVLRRTGDCRCHRVRGVLAHRCGHLPEKRAVNA